MKKPVGIYESATLCFREVITEAGCLSGKGYSASVLMLRPSKI